MSRLEAAVRNNAQWCDAVCRALGLRTDWADGCWLDLDPGPPYYSSAVCVDPSAVDAQVRRLRRMLAGPLPRPWTVKDAYHVLDLEPDGFEVLFAATWLTLDAGVAVPADPGAPALQWAAAATPDDLVAWERAWRGTNPDVEATGMDSLFQPALLADPDIRFLAGRGSDGAIEAAVAANRSGEGAEAVVGISNIVLAGADPERHRAATVRAVRDAFPDLPMVGYERGDDLDAMLPLGFRPLGPLRVWITR